MAIPVKRYYKLSKPLFYMLYYANGLTMMHSIDQCCLNFSNHQGVNLSYARLIDQTKTVFLKPNDFKRNKSYYKLLKPLFYMLYYTNGLTIKTKFNLKTFLISSIHFHNVVDIAKAFPRIFDNLCKYLIVSSNL